MNTFKLVWKNISRQKSAALLSILLTAFGITILTVLYISSDILEKQLENNSKNIDLVVGAKGSPMQLILSSLYHVDNPTGNIPLSDADQIAQNPLVQQAVPISLGDNFKGHRIIGTSPAFLELYELKIQEGRNWNQSFEAVLGSEVARKHQLKPGDRIYGAHGLSADAHTHDEHPFTVVGILKPAHNVVDNIILCNLESVWDVHGIAHDHEHIHDENCNHDHDEHQHSHDKHTHDHTQDATQTHIHEEEHTHHGHQEELVSEKPQDQSFIKSIGQDMIEDQGLEITALLIKYRSPAAISVIPRLVNQSTNMQAASPAIESTRIFSLLGIAIDTATILAYIIMTIAGLSIFISLYNALKERKYDLAIMRTMGASRTKLFSLVIVEAIAITIIGSIAGIIFAHVLLYYISTQTSESADFVTAFTLYKEEVLIIFAALLLGVLAAIIPAIKAYNTTISKTLGSK